MVAMMWRTTAMSTHVSARLTTSMTWSLRLTRAASRSSSTSCPIIHPTSTPGSKPLLPPALDRPSAPVIYSAMVAANMASCLPPIGMPTLAARLDACCGRSVVAAYVYARAAGLCLVMPRGSCVLLRRPDVEVTDVFVRFARASHNFSKKVLA